MPIDEIADECQNATGEKRIHTQQLGRLLSIESFLDKFILCIISSTNKESRGCAAGARPGLHSSVGYL